MVKSFLVLGFLLVTLTGCAGVIVIPPCQLMRPDIVTWADCVGWPWIGEDE